MAGEHNIAIDTRALSKIGFPLIQHPFNHADFIKKCVVCVKCYNHNQQSHHDIAITQIARFMGPTWDPPGSCRPQVGPMLAPQTLAIRVLHCLWHVCIASQRFLSKIPTIYLHIHTELLLSVSVWLGVQSSFDFVISIVFVRQRFVVRKYAEVATTI